MSAQTQNFENFEKRSHWVSVVRDPVQQEKRSKYPKKHTLFPFKARKDLKPKEK
jgi:hypothetical protein